MLLLHLLNLLGQLLILRLILHTVRLHLPLLPTKLGDQRMFFHELLVLGLLVLPFFGLLLSELILAGSRGGGFGALEDVGITLDRITVFV